MRARGEEDATAKEPDTVATAPREPGMLADTLQTLDRFWFGYGSPTALGLFRIAISALTVISLAMLMPQWDDWFTERGFVPDWLGARYLNTRVAVGYGTSWTLPRISLLSGVTDSRIILAFLLATILCGVLTTFGLWTRVSSILFALGVVSIQHRDAVILYGGDSITRLGALYIAIAPSGKACSIDRLIGLWKGRLGSAPVEVSMWPQRLIAYNTALIYVTSSWLKWQGTMWQNGTATYYTARVAEFFRFPVPGFFNEVPFVYFTTYATLAVEFSMATLVFFRPLRKYILFAGILLHLDIEYSMNVPLFSYLMIALYICFYDGEEVSAWARRVGMRLGDRHVTVLIPVGMGLRAPAAAFLGAIDPFCLVQYSPGEGDGWTARRPDGSALPAVRAIVSRSVGSWAFAWCPGLLGRILQSAVEPSVREPQTVGYSESDPQSRPDRYGGERQ